jgi:hypothetical protein
MFYLLARARARKQLCRNVTIGACARSVACIGYSTVIGNTIRVTSASTGVSAGSLT